MNAHVSPWTLENTHMLVALAKEGVAVPVISMRLKRSIIDVLAKLNDLGLAPPIES